MRFLLTAFFTDVLVEVGRGDGACYLFSYYLSEDN